MKRRALVFWPLALAFTAACVAWLWYVPYQPALLHKAVPASADILGAHYNLQDRWDAVAGHPLILRLLDSLGVERAGLEQLGRDPGFRRLLKLVASDEVLMAHVPRMRSTGEPAWVFAAWLGGNSQRARWMLKSLKHPELKRAATRNGWLVWVWAPRELKGQRVTFALVEGMLVGCVATETLGIDDLLAGVDGHAVTLADRPWLYVAGVRAQGEVDRGWYRDARGALFPFRFALTPEGGLQARVETPWRIPVRAESAATTGTVGTLSGFHNLVGDRAVAVAAVDRAWLRQGLIVGWTNLVGRELAGLMAGDGDGPVGLALLGGEYSGRFMAVRLPTLVAGVSGSPVAQTRHVLGALDRINALTRWGLVAAPVMVDNAPAFAIEATGDSVYARLDRDENLAYTPTADGLVFASNLATLERLLKERATNRVEQGVWPEADRLGEGSTRGRLWFDAAEGAKVVRLGVTAWSLKLLLEDPQGSQATRQRLNEFKAWMDLLVPLGQVRLEVEELGGKAVFAVQTGER